MSTYTHTLLSGSTDGLPIKVTGTNAGGAVTVHTADASANDEVWLWAQNLDGTDRLLTLGYADLTDPDDLLLEETISAQSGLFIVVPGIPITNSLVLKAFAAAAGVIMLSGHVNRIGA